jgi:glycine C-acetyltransferase
MASVRFICGTQDRAQGSGTRARRVSQTDDCILYSSCFDANGGLFETLLDEDDAIISDELNHASIIDGVRLSKAKRFRYKNNDMADLEAKLLEAEAAGARFKLIATDGVFSMDGIIANLAGICDLADRYGALVMVDDSHAVGFVGEHGRGTPEHCGVLAHRHHHRHARQGAGRRIRRLRGRAQGDRRAAAPALAALSVLQHAGPGDCGASLKCST